MRVRVLTGVAPALAAAILGFSLTLAPAFARSPLLPPGGGDHGVIAGGQDRHDGDGDWRRHPLHGRPGWTLGGFWPILQPTTAAPTQTGVAPMAAESIVFTLPAAAPRGGACVIHTLIYDRAGRYLGERRKTACP